MRRRKYNPPVDLGLERELSLREVLVALLLLGRDHALLVLGQSAADSAGLLRAEVLGNVPGGAGGVW